MAGIISGRSRRQRMSRVDHAQRLRCGEVVRGTAADGGKDGDCKGATEKRWSPERIECSSLADKMRVFVAEDVDGEAGGA